MAIGQVIKMCAKHHSLYKILLHSGGSLALGWVIYQYSGSAAPIAFTGLPTYIPKIIANYLPDALWMYALTSFFCIWHQNHPKERWYWNSMALLLGISYEVAQYKHWVAGTPDFLDILAYGIGWVIAIKLIGTSSTKTLS